MYKFYTLKLTFTSDSLYNNNFIIIYNNYNNFCLYNFKQTLTRTIKNYVEILATQKQEDHRLRLYCQVST